MKKSSCSKVLVNENEVDAHHDHQIESAAAIVVSGEDVGGVASFTTQTHALQGD